MSDEDNKKQLKEQIKDLESEILCMQQKLSSLKQSMPEDENAASTSQDQLTSEDIERYSRQLLLPNFGVKGQLKLKNAAVLIVGVGGLGCPAAQYLVAAGCGRIGLVDYDEVDRSNIHRQILHNESSVREAKVRSAATVLRKLNSNCKIEEFQIFFGISDALEIIAQYDVVLDCTDNAATRYLLNDACVLKQKPLVSGSALRMEGQLTVYNYGVTCPCYRCIYPVPPPASCVTNCSEGGVLGAITGVIGTMQALEAIKIIVGNDFANAEDVLAGRMIVFDGSCAKFLTIKLRKRRIDCAVCSPNPMITQLIDYEQFCGASACDKNPRLEILPDNQRIDAIDYFKMMSKPHLLIDVRQPAEFDMCRLPKAVNVPLKEVLNDSYLNRLTEFNNLDLPVIVVCRRGNDSQIAVHHIKNKFPNHSICDIYGGLHSWHSEVDKSFPIY